ncbi:PREDICTED: potassium voltage-gated channel subfamily S member 3 isoform X2 [Odobenus rosmarus divergens]|uniref:Potassium voltage-gated channel subfamily S member 3 isoform X2 n=1 Tax=Odobenus rosmarus divergens TaxID=9708 RepID=A0A2U3WFJ5_ODORO|nr:PREDICTED: potassium voltage-gated channel subfamily S member 3 isoform X2 [Odobenus rosmarus divergens]
MVFGEFFHRPGPDEELVNLNVGGFKQSVDQSTLLRFPHTRLGKLLTCHSEEAILELCDDYSVADKEYYFDRNPSLFRYVLNFYYTGKLHVMEELCVFSFCQEIEYWGINELFLDSCCSNRYQERKEENHEKDWDQKSNDVSTDSSSEESSLFEKELEKFDEMRFGQLRKKIWIRMENPAYCLSAKLIAISSLSVVLASIVAMCVHSMSEFQNEDREVDDPVLEGVEIACIAWFTGELAIRLVAAPCQKKFWKNPLNIIDFVSIIPFYATLAVDTKEEESEDIENMGKVVQILRLMRIFRILKLARHSVGLRSLGATLRHSYHEVGLLLLFLSVGISIFSVLIYSVEKDEHTCIVCGILVVALPITIIFNKFSKYYQKQKDIDVDQCSEDPPEKCHELPYFNIRDIYAQRMHAFITSLSSVGIVVSDPDSTDASSIEDNEDVYNTASLENCTAK